MVSCFGWTALGPTRPSPTPTKYDRLLSIIRPGRGKTPPANLEQVLSALPEEWLANFTFVYSSRSPDRDEVDSRFPRVVLFSTDGRLLLAFTGNPRASSYNRLEVIYFDDVNSSFHTSRFILEDATTRDPRLTSQAALNGSLDQYECTRCHGGDVRPIFDSYSLWPGFYGSRGDRPDAFPKEREDYRRFLAENSDKGLYRYLRFPSGSPTTPYQDGSMRLSPGDALRFHPNERLGDALAPLNWKRIVRKLAARGDTYRRLRYPLLAGMLGAARFRCLRRSDPGLGADGEPATARARRADRRRRQRR